MDKYPFLLFFTLQSPCKIPGLLPTAFTAFTSTITNVFLSFYEIKWLEQCPKEFKLVLYRRYVDEKGKFEVISI